MQELAACVRTIPDFPKPGIQFKDITPLLKEPALRRRTIQALTRPFRDKALTAVAGIEARGFIFGALAAQQLDTAFIPLRKPGKLPDEVERISYELEYGAAGLEVHIDALDKHDRVLLVDDLIATGGTAAAGCALIERLGAEVVACAFVIELDALKGREQLRGYEVHSLLHY